jgi:hypothetical protein
LVAACISAAHCVPVTPVLCVDAPEITVMTCQYNKYSGEFEELRKEEL